MADDVGVNTHAKRAKPAKAGFSAIWRVIASISFLAIPLGLRAERVYRRLPTLPPLSPSERGGQGGVESASLPPLSTTEKGRQGGEGNATFPSLSIIIPARNEAHNLPALLASLQALRYPGPLEIIVVDDHSTDGTGDIATKMGVRVIHPPTLPPGVLGKPHACHWGAQAASGDWLLFTDADTLHAPNSATQAVAYAQTHGLDGVSLFLRQACRGALDRLALMAAFAALFAGQPSTQRLLNGQYILLRRSVYEQSGGFAQVWREPLEDLALGHRLAAQGYRVPMLRAEDAATVRMYHSLGQMWQGLSRLGAGSLRWTGLGAGVTALFITALMSPLLAGLGVALKRLSPRWLALTWATAVLCMLPWARRFGGQRWAVLVPLGALVVQLAGSWGLMLRLFRRGIRWKGRQV